MENEKKIVCPSCNKETRYFEGQFKDVTICYHQLCNHCEAVVIAPVDPIVM